jgi:hypothetical protein
VSQQTSGLRNPAAAVRGVGAAALGAEALVMLLAIVPLNVLDRGSGVAVTITIVGFAVAFAALVAQLRHSWAWNAASLLQVALFVAGLVLHVSLSVLAVIFGLVWLYVLGVRRRVLR